MRFTHFEQYNYLQWSPFYNRCFYASILGCLWAVSLDTPAAHLCSLLTTDRATLHSGEWKLYFQHGFLTKITDSGRITGEWINNRMCSCEWKSHGELTVNGKQGVFPGGKIIDRNAVGTTAPKNVEKSMNARVPHENSRNQPKVS